MEVVIAGEPKDCAMKEHFFISLRTHLPKLSHNTFTSVDLEAHQLSQHARKGAICIRPQRHMVREALLEIRDLEVPRHQQLVGETHHMEGGGG